MKNKSNISKKPVIAQGVPPRDLRMKTDELLDMIEKSYDASAGSLFDLVDSMIPVLLLLREVIIQEAVDDDLVLDFQGSKRRYCSMIEAVGEILSGFPARLYETRHRMDEESTRISAAISSYRGIHKKVAAA